MARHEPTIPDLDKPYEHNVISINGILKFGVGLLVLIVITFVLMALLYNVLQENPLETKTADNPMAMGEKQRLPPEPRLQLAPGFGVESPDGRVNMELGAPQAEYRELKKQWDVLREQGSKDPKTGAVTALSIDEAKAKVLKQALKAKSGPDAEKFVEESRKYFSDASSGRMKSATRK